MSGIHQMFFSGGGETFVLLASTSSSGTTPSVTIPAHSGQAGDLVVFGTTGTANSSTPSDVSPSGYTAITTSSLLTTYGYRASTFYKVSTGSTSGETITGISSGGVGQAFVAVYRRLTGAISSVTVSSLAQTAVATNPAAQTITISTASSFPALAVGLFAQASTAGSWASNGRTQSRTPEATLTVGTSQMMFWVDSAASTDISVDTGDAGDANIMQSFYLTFT